MKYAMCVPNAVEMCMLILALFRCFHIKQYTPDQNIPITRQISSKMFLPEELRES